MIGQGRRRNDTDLFCIFIFAASALKCYVCMSKQSMSDCDSGRIETECLAGFDQCAKMSIDYTFAGIETTLYTKTCSTEALCDDSSAVFKQCKEIDGASCKWDCCSGNLCNGGTTAVVSVFLMVACALVALFR